ncbi:hypothetical protein ElP_73890 (plasmid) [Tautonia plasticadhaerens]|uniref:Uncharacterized protein n=1 Tax=Tautonia plasticadhaerens TaxID=2527974 RepID=A0A518HF09_9BACT|nr:hypothetical protein ElP_73890 [Tautonia plasticadhaerens]
MDSKVITRFTIFRDLLTKNRYSTRFRKSPGRQYILASLCKSMTCRIQNRMAWGVN